MEPVSCPISPGRQSIDLGIVCPFDEALGVAHAENMCLRHLLVALRFSRRLLTQLVSDQPNTFTLFMSSDLCYRTSLVICHGPR